MKHHTIVCPNCGKEIELLVGSPNCDLYIQNEQYEIHCNHCLGTFKATYTDNNFIPTIELIISRDKPSLVDTIKGLEKACDAAKEFTAHVTDKTPKQTLVVEYMNGSEKRITFDKPVRLCVNDIFGTVNVYDENDDCLFHTSKSLVRTAMLLVPSDKIATGHNDGNVEG